MRLNECPFHEVQLEILSFGEERILVKYRPAAAVIPAPIAYIKVVAVKKLVVEVWSRTLGLLHCMYLAVRDFLPGERPPSGGPEPGPLL